MQKMMIEAPASDSSRTIESLGYIDAYDAPLNSDYAFVAYKETDRDTGAWRVRVKSSQTAGGVFEPDAIQRKARETGAQGKAWFQWGYSFDPSASDPRTIQFRVHVKDGKPSGLELFVQLRKFDNTPDEAKSVMMAWPA